MSAEVRRPDELEAKYLKRKAAIRADESLSWEEKELTIKQLGDEHYRARRQLERVAT
jgi:hypothetical protein